MPSSADGQTPDLAFENLVDLLTFRAKTAGDKIVYRFLGEQAEEIGTRTYRELHTRAIAIAHDLQQHMQPGDRAGIEAIDTTFETPSIYDLVVTARHPDLSLERLVAALVPIYFGRVGSFVIENRNVPTDAAEDRVERQAREFELLKPYLVERWRADMEAALEGGQSQGIALLVDTGVADQVLPEVPARLAPLLFAPPPCPGVVLKYNIESADGSAWNSGASSSRTLYSLTGA